MNVALCIIATGKYITFVEPLLASADRHFFPYESRRYHLFTDTKSGPMMRVMVHPVPKTPWPTPTLFRYHYILSAVDHFTDCEYVFYIDADSLFVGNVAEEVCCTGLTAVEHSGYVGRRPQFLPYCRKRRSTAYVQRGHGEKYYAGGFQGGRTRLWIEAMQDIAERIDEDMANEITAEWHDESHWNRYLIDHPPSIALSPEYCRPESSSLPKRIVALDKNHRELRGICKQL